MDEYIKREAAMGIFGDVPMWDGYYEPYPFEVHCAIVGVVKLIKEELSKAPAADVAPVVHGRWIYDEKAQRPYCSVCKGYFYGATNSPMGYCPNCGAKMDGGDNDATD